MIIRLKLFESLASYITGPRRDFRDQKFNKLFYSDSFIFQKINFETAFVKDAKIFALEHRALEIILNRRLES